MNDVIKLILCQGASIDTKVIECYVSWDTTCYCTFVSVNRKTAWPIDDMHPCDMTRGWNAKLTCGLEYPTVHPYKEVKMCGIAAITVVEPLEFLLSEKQNKARSKFLVSCWHNTHVLAWYIYNDFISVGLKIGLKVNLVINLSSHYPSCNHS